MPNTYRTRSLNKLNRLDIIDLAPNMPAFLLQVSVGIGFFALSAGARETINMWAPGAGPFAINTPFILISTLIGRFNAGLITLILASIFTWYYVLPVTGSFSFERESDGPRTVVNIVTGLIIVILADLARTTGRGLVREKEERIAERDMLLAEVDHRVKNNLAILASLLSLQQRESDNEEVQLALEKAGGRVQSLAKAYESLRYDNVNQIAVVDLGEFLKTLSESIKNILILDGKVQIRLETEQCQLSRDRAGAVGLLVNELATNSVKHAFHNRDSGEIIIRLRRDGDGAVLEFSDNGVGIADNIRDGAQGGRFLQAFAQMAKGNLECQSDENGTRYTCQLETLP